MPISAQLKPVSPIPHYGGQANPFQTESSSVISQWAQSCASRAFRDYAGVTLDRHLQYSPRWSQHIAEMAEPLTRQSQNYMDLFNLQRFEAQVGKGEYFETYRSYFGSKDGWLSYKEALTDSFKDAKLPKNLNVKSFIKNTLIAPNVDAVTSYWKEGKFFTGLSKVLGIGMSCIPIIHRACETYKDTQSSVKTSITVAKESLKAIVAWEVGSIGFVLGMILMPVSGLSYFAGLIGMGIASVLAHKLIEILFPHR